MPNMRGCATKEYGNSMPHARSAFPMKPLTVTSVPGNEPGISRSGKETRTCMAEDISARLWRLGQLRHLDLLALAFELVPGIGKEVELGLARASREHLIDLLTRDSG